MFIGNMVTEAIPARVYALYKIVAAKKEIPRVTYMNEKVFTENDDFSSYTPREY